MPQYALPYKHMKTNIKIILNSNLSLRKEKKLN